MTTTNATATLVKWTQVFKPETTEQKMAREMRELQAEIATRKAWIEDQRSKFNYRQTSKIDAAGSFREGIVEAFMLLMRYTDPVPDEWWGWGDLPRLYGQRGALNTTMDAIVCTRATKKPAECNIRGELIEMVKHRSLLFMDGGELAECQMMAIRKIFKHFKLTRIPAWPQSDMGMFQITDHQMLSRGNMSPWYPPLWTSPTLFFTYFNRHEQYQYIINADPWPDRTIERFIYDKTDEIEAEKRAKALRASR